MVKRNKQNPRRGRRINARRAPKVSFAKRVNQIIARNIENKYTSNAKVVEPIHTIVTTVVGGVASNAHTFFTWSPGYPGTSGNIFNISQGTAVNERVGNGIKIKRWIIKGLIQPGSEVTTNLTQMGNSFMGYVDLYFGKLNLNVAPVPNALTSFYQNGATDVTPTGDAQEQLFRVNKDIYKIYYHKRIKLGVASATHQPGTVFASQSNDFGLCRSFGFDVTKYICKNKMLKYDELSTTPQSADVENLTLWAVFHPAVGSVTLPSAAGTVKSFYYMNVCSYAEYEDA